MSIRHENQDWNEKCSSPQSRCINSGLVCGFFKMKANKSNGSNATLPTEISRAPEIRSAHQEESSQSHWEVNISVRTKGKPITRI